MKRRCTLLLMMPAQALTLKASFTSTSDYDWLWTNSDQQTKHENNEKGLLQSTPWLLFTQRELFKKKKKLNLFYLDVKDAWFRQ